MVLVLSILAACATPYQPMGFLGGYTNRDLGGGRYAIDVQVNGYTSALDYAYRRAGELCPTGYDIVDGSKSSSPYVYASKGYVTAGSKPDVALVVQCKRDVDTAQAIGETQPPTESTSSPQERRIVTASLPIYCTTPANDLTVGLCSRDEARCDEMKASLEAASPDNAYTGCAKRTGAACFNMYAVIDGKRTTVCAPSVKNCEARLVGVKANPDFTVATICGVYRVQAEIAVTQARDSESPSSN